MTCRSLSRPAAGAAVLAAAAVALGGCTTTFSGDKVDYRSAGNQTRGLDVPPDLTQLTRDARYQQPGGVVSATDYQAAVPVAAAQAVTTAGSVAPSQAGPVKLERLGNERWLSTSLPAEQLWPQLRAFWQERGFGLDVDDPATGTMETQWGENRAKLPQDAIRRTIGRAFENLYSTGERDKFRVRVERAPTGGSEIYITHRGMVEVYTDQQKTQTVWQPRPADPQLEGEFLSRLMVKLGGVKEEEARAALAATTAPAAVPAAATRARLVEGQPAATMQVDDGFDRAWRRVGLALDRSGFTVEDRDRSQGQYFVRYVDPARAGREEPGFFGKLFSFGRKRNDADGPVRYRVSVKADAGSSTSSTVTVLNAQGGPENGEAGRRIVRLLVDDLK